MSLTPPLSKIVIYIRSSVARPIHTFTHFARHGCQGIHLTTSAKMWKVLMCLLVVVKLCATGAFQFHHPGSFNKFFSRGALTKTSSWRKTSLSLARRREIPYEKRHDANYGRWSKMEERINRVAPRHDLPAMFVDMEGDPEMELELFTEEDLAGFKTHKVKLELGDTVTGVITSINKEGAHIRVESAGKSAFVPNREGSLWDIDSMNEMFQIGQEITGEMVGTLKGVPVVSLRRALLIDAWDFINATRTANAPIYVNVLEVNKGGAMCGGPRGLHAFLPASQATAPLTEALEGTRLQVKILDAVEEEGKLVVSQRLLAAPATAPFKRGSLVQGRVTGVRPYGVFIELDNGQVGLLHISQISNLRLSAEEMEGLFAMEERVSAVMMEFDREQGRMALSTKLLELQPGDMVRNKAETQKHAEANLARYHQRVVDERAAREEAAKEFVASITAALADGGALGDKSAAPGARESTGAFNPNPNYPNPRSNAVASDKKGVDRSAADAVADAVAAVIAASDAFAMVQQAPFPVVSVPVVPVPVVPIPVVPDLVQTPVPVQGETENHSIDADTVSAGLESEEGEPQPQSQPQSGLQREPATGPVTAVVDATTDIGSIKDIGSTDSSGRVDSAKVGIDNIEVEAATVPSPTRKPRAPRAVSMQKSGKVEKEGEQDKEVEQEGGHEKEVAKGAKKGVKKEVEKGEKEEVGAGASVDVKVDAIGDMVEVKVEEPVKKTRAPRKPRTTTTTSTTTSSNSSDALSFMSLSDASDASDASDVNDVSTLVEGDEEQSVRVKKAGRVSKKGSTTKVKGMKKGAELETEVSIGDN